MKCIFERPYFYWFFGIFVFYLILSVVISGFYNTFPLIIIYAKTINWMKLGFSLILTLIIGFLVAFNMVLVYIKYKEREKCKGAGIATAGTVGGLIVGVCPLCVTGLFPLILGLLGISFSFAFLPFQGIEIQFLIVGLLLISLKILKTKTFK